MVRSRHNTPRRQANQVFVEDGKPVSFYFYGTKEEPSAWTLLEGQVEALRQMIVQHGGQVCDTLGVADTVIVREAGVQQLRDRFRLIPGRYTEPPTFISKCIRAEKYAHDRVQQHALPGRRPGIFRQEFTKNDDYHLCLFLAQTIPDPEAGGRTGNRLYRELIEVSARHNPEHEWALRHPAQSWRERYKKRKEIFDPVIARLAKKFPPAPDGQGLFPYDRRMNKQHNYQAFMHLQGFEDDEGDEFEPSQDLDEEDEQFEKEPVRRPTPRRRQTDVGVQRNIRNAERWRGRTRSAPLDVNRHRSLTPPGEFQPSFEDDEFEQPAGAGPSGIQRTPAPSRSPSPLNRPNANAIVRELDAAKIASQLPMSSQATLVGPVPSQLRSGPERLKAPEPQPTRKAPAPPLAKKRKLNPLPPVPVVEIPALARVGHRSRARTQQAPAVTEKAREEEDEVQSYPVGQTNEEELDVEELLGGNVEIDGSLSPARSEVLDSDDERARQKLLLNHPQPTRAMSSLSLKRPLPLDEEDGGDDEAFADSLNLTGVSSRSSSGIRRPLPVAMPAWRGGREPTDWSTSEEDGVPLPGTRAREHVERKEYDPPSGSRAANALKQERTRVVRS